MVGASKLRVVAKKIGLPCVSFSRRQVTDDPVIIHNGVSNSTVSSKRENVSAMAEEGAESSSITKNLCAICLEPLSYSTGTRPGQAIFTAQCSHAFHFTCISSNVRHGSVTCPICRAYWTQLPRDLNPPSVLPTNQSDPILRILDDSIATFRVHRRSSLRSARYDDDDPVEADHSPNQDRLQFTLVPASPTHLAFPPCGQVVDVDHGSYHPCGLSGMHQFTGSSSQNASPTRQQQHYLCTNNRAHHHLSVKLAQQQATDLVLVASPNGPHLRLLKQSMALVVFSLRSVDRLAIVTYSSTATRAFPLRRMTAHGKRTALQVIDRLFYMGEADPGAGLKKGMKILQDRIHQNPQSTILHLSDSPTRSFLDRNLEVIAPVHWFYVGFGSGTSSGFVMHEFEEFLARLLGGVIRDTHLRIGEDGQVVRLGELRGGEERRIPLDLGETDFTCVTYSYIEGGGEECIRTGEIAVSLEDKRQGYNIEEASGREVSIGGRTSNVESWDYHDPYMARRWAKHLHGYRL